MARCARCWLHKSIRFVNLITFLLAIGMIIYSLWLQKKWNDGVAELPTTVLPPTPWFIYTCLGVGIAVCLSTLFGHIVANCISHSTLCMYIVAVFSLLLLEAAVIFAIFFRIDWQKLIANFIEEYHKFKVFIVFHLKMCQLITIVILVPQLLVLGLSVLSQGGIGVTQNPPQSFNHFWSGLTCLCLIAQDALAAVVKIYSKGIRRKAKVNSFFAERDLEVESLSIGAAHTALEEWMGTVAKIIQHEEVLPESVLAHPGAGTRKFSHDLAAAFASHINKLAATFRQSEDKASCFVATREDFVSWVPAIKTLHCYSLNVDNRDFNL